MIEFSIKYSNMFVNLELHHRVLVLLGDSSTGKTFLTKILIQNANYLEQRLTVINYANYKKIYKLLPNDLGKDDLVILDNADLYMDDELSAFIAKSDAYFIIMLKSLSLLKEMSSDYHYGKVKHTSELLEVIS